MGKASSSKKVARAASTGGGRTSRGRTPWVWYSVMSLVVLLGVLGIYTSRADLDKAAADPPAIGKDHWHAAYGVYICGSYLPPLVAQMGILGIHTHEDGLIHIEPRSARAAGKNARLKLFLDEVSLKLTKSTLELPGDKKYTDGDKCEGKKGDLRVLLWETPDDDTPEVLKSDPNTLRLKQAQVIAVVFAPEGAEIPKPPTAGKVTEASEPAPMPPPGAPTTSGVPTTAPPAGGGATTSTP